MIQSSTFIALATLAVVAAVALLIWGLSALWNRYLAPDMKSLCAGLVVFLALLYALLYFAFLSDLPP